MTPSENENQARKKRRLATSRPFKLGVRLVLFASLVGALIFGDAPLVRNVMQTSPALFLASILSTRRLPENLVFGTISSAIFLACVCRRRFFCRYVCPLGACVDAAAGARRRLFKRPILRFGITRVLRAFPILALVWIAAIVLPFLYPNVKIPFDLSPLAFDPMSLLVGWLKGGAVGLALAIFIACFLLSSYAWRFQVCPCGLLQELLYLPARICQRIRARLRRKTTACAANRAARPTSRRAFLFGAASTAVLAALWTFSSRLAKGAQKIFFRPPGALPSPKFEALCSQCGECVRACPTRILVPAPPESTPSLPLASTLRGTPAVDFERGERYCEKDCVACSEVCPTGAIAPITIPTKPASPIAIAAFRLDYCLLYYQRECSICRRECPYDAIDFVWSDEEYASLPTIQEDVCVGCGRCVAFCPGAAEFLDDDAENPKALSLKRRKG